MDKASRKPSRKASRKTHADASHLTRKEGIYYYRRALPEWLGEEVAVSLGTRNYREAQHLAGALDPIYKHAVKTASDIPDLRRILREYLEEFLAEDADMRLAAPRGRPVYTSMDQVDDQWDATDADLDVIDFLLSDTREQLMTRDYRAVTSVVDRLMREHKAPEEQRNALAHGVLEAHLRGLEEVRRRVLGEAPLVLVPELAPLVAQQAQPEPTGPLLSEVLPRYIDYAVKDKGWRGQSKAQNESTFEMFREVCGDLPVTAYSRRTLSEFYDTLRALPSLYSKDARWRGMSIRQIVEAAKDDPAPRLTMKTLKRHFSALGGLFTYAKRHGFIEGENPAHGFEFPTQGRANSGRKLWEGEKLRTLFQSPVWTGCHPVRRTQAGPQIIKDDKYWLPLLGLYHGNRLEEFAQLRREDIKQQDGIWYFDIHGEGGRQIKNEQSARRVPLHPEMERRGFLDYVTEVARDLLVRLRSAAKDYSPLTIHAWRTGGGKSAFADHGDKLAAGIALAVVTSDANTNKLGRA